MVLTEVRAEVARYATKMERGGLVRATQGNLSVRDSESGLICITPSGVEYEALRAEDIVVLNADGEVVEGVRRPSSEWPVHARILCQRPDVHCVMHTHSPYATALGVVNQPLPMVLAESAMCLGCTDGLVPIVPYQVSGTPDFADRVAAYLGSANAVIWGNHGALVVGPNVALTYSAAHALEDGAHIYTIARQLGTPTPLHAVEVARLQQYWREHYVQPNA